VGILAALAGVATLYALNPAAFLSQYLLTAGVLACMYTAACAINDYWDLDQDRINHPECPLPSGRLSPAQAWWTSILLLGAALMVQDRPEAIVAALIFFASLVAGQPLAMLYPTGFLFCYILAKEIISNLTQTVLFNCSVGTLNPTGLY